jgi:hypothetical protein
MGVPFLRDTFQVEYQSLQSYDNILHAAGVSWKKSQATYPKKRCPDRGTSGGIDGLCKSRSGMATAMLFVDECVVCWGDALRLG